MSPREHWDTVCQTLGIPIPVSTIWFEKLATNYNQSNRYYHNTNILKCKLDALKDHGYQPIQSHLIFAIFFQYYQFDVKRNCCTENCEAFRSFCRDAALDDDKLIEAVCCLLGETTNGAIESDLLLFQDIDLLVFGSSAANYRAYSEQLQTEYSHLSSDAYKTMRLKILQSFLQIPNIYSSASIKDRFEATARANIKREIDQLKQQN